MSVTLPTSTLAHELVSSELNRFEFECSGMFENVEVPQVQHGLNRCEAWSFPHSAFFLIMRNYGQQPIHLGGKRRATGHQRTELYSKREATEWDIRLDVNEVLTAEVVINNIKERLDELCYVLVSGVERPDNINALANQGSTHGSTEHHVHLCVVLHKPLKRGDVLQLVRGTRKLGDEYCAPRNPRFSYAGWIIHHGKPGYKIDDEPLIRFEWGTLPMDPFTEDAASKIKSLLNKWGTPDMKQRFKGYTDLITKESIKRKIEQLQMSLEDQDAN